MDWIKLDTGFWSHPKTLRAGRPAAANFLIIVCWSRAQMTDGRIPKDTLPRILGRRWEAPIERLLSAGFLHDRGDYYEIHNYAKRQETREKIEKRRGYERDRWHGRSKGDSGAESAEANARSQQATPHVRGEERREEKKIPPRPPQGGSDSASRQEGERPRRQRRRDQEPRPVGGLRPSPQPTRDEISERRRQARRTVAEMLRSSSRGERAEIAMALNAACFGAEGADRLKRWKTKLLELAYDFDDARRAAAGGAR